MSHLPLSCNKRTNKIQKRGKEIDFWQRYRFKPEKNILSFQILKMLNGFWQPLEKFLENFILKI